jgi:hypothetical protein
MEIEVEKNVTPPGGKSRGNRHRKMRGGTTRRNWQGRPGTKAFIGLYSPEERKQLFLKYFEKQGPLGTVKSTQSAIENPYQPKSWYTSEELETIISRFPDIPPSSDIYQRFNARYQKVVELKSRHESATKPALYMIESVGSYFKHVLYERGDLFMKVVPLEEEEEDGTLFVLDNDKLSEIYNEIVVGYFLNELVYGYSNVLSIHFMTVVDWFVALKDSLTEEDVEASSSSLHQIIVAEKLDVSVWEYLNTRHDLPILKAIIFQVCHALEVAWYTNEYTHNDLHTLNIMLKRFSDDSPLKDRHFMYRRLVDNKWYRIKRTALRNKMVKIIDFGRNRMLCPSTVDHIEDDGEHRHLHDNVTCSTGLEHFGYPCDEPNRFIDVKTLLLFLLDQWNEVAANDPKEDKKQFHDMCNRMIDFDMVNTIVDGYYKGKYRGDDHLDEEAINMEWHYVGQKVSAENYHQCRNVQALLKLVGHYDEQGNLHPGVFIYRMGVEGEKGATPTDVLNDPFFDEYKLDVLVPDHTIPPEEIYSIKGDHVVVSFITHPEEATLLSSSPSSAGGNKCAVCNAPNPNHIAGNDLLCGAACHDFKYLFEGKTVYR